MADARCIFLSKPRSGTHLFLNAMMHFFGAPCYKLADELCYKNSGNVPIDNSLTPLFHVHNYLNVEKKKQEGDTLIYIIRDYKENCLNQDHDNLPSCKTNQELLAFFSNPALYETDRYFVNLTYFDTWDDTRKLFIYYEDLLEDPVSCLKSVATFLDYPFDEETIAVKLNTFTTVTSALRDQYYTKFHKRKDHASLGCATKHYQLRFPSEIRAHADALVEEHFPLYEKYLKRYHELLNEENL